MLILAIESSCDDTSCALVEDGHKVLSNVVSSQIELHREYGGVFPELASRLHIQNINYVIKKAMAQANKRFEDLDAIAVTQGPGLIGSLHVGVMAAKTLSWSLNIPLIPVHHIAGHIYANKLNINLEFPLLAMVVSGGHTELILMHNDYEFKILGKTQDDAVGEAYDKVARQMGLEYPGGPVIDRMAQKGQANYRLPKVKTENPLDFSFSGLKSAVRQTILREEREGRELIKEDLAASFQKAAVGQLIERLHYALDRHSEVKTCVIAGGVAANSQMRKEVELSKEKYQDILFSYPPLWACMDQAAMIGIAAYTAYQKGIVATCDLSALSNIDIEVY